MATISKFPRHCFSPNRHNLGFLTEGKLAAIFIKPSLGVPNWPVVYFINSVASSSFWRHCRGRVEDLCKGSSSHAHPLLCFKFCFILFLLALFYQKHKKLVPTVVVIFVGLLLSCFIMLSINGWFL
jgi:hypothetical protein